MGYIYNVLDNHFVKTNDSEAGMPQLMWHITNRCRLHCKFCFSVKNTDETDIKNLDKYIQKFTDLKVQKIDLSGGEPMLYDFFPEICQALFEAGIYITVTTRAIGLESNINWVLNNIEKFARIIVSIDVPLLEPFIELCGNEEAWRRTQKLLQRLKDMQCMHVRVNTVVTPYLLNDFLLSKLAETIALYNCREWCLIEAHPANKKETFDQVKLSHEQFLDVINKAKKLWEELVGHRLLVREQTNYADYWVLYPNGFLAKHTDGEEDEERIIFLDAQSNDILHRIKNKIWLPEDKI